MKHRIEQLRIETKNIKKEVEDYILNYIDINDGVKLNYNVSLGWLDYSVPSFGQGCFNEHGNLTDMDTEGQCYVGARSIEEFEEQLKEKERRKKTVGQIGIAFAYIINK